MRLVEPLGLLVGSAAADSVGAGLALPLIGGPLAFTLARLIDTETRGGIRGAADIVPVARVPAPYHQALRRLTAPRPALAALPQGRPLVMGIVNITPDSFSDAGVHFEPRSAIESARAMMTAGADLIDVGGEGTSPETERARILPVIRDLANAGIAVSVDTRNADTMEAALAAGARIVNDVSALHHDPRAAGVVARHACPVILMHMRGDPATMMGLAAYDDVAVDVTQELAERVAAAVAAGIARERIAVDPGLGFAKGPGQNEELLRRLPILANLGCPIVVGASRKGFIGRLSGEADARRRVAGSIAAALYAVSRGASVVRVHDVAETVQALRVWRGVAGGDDARGGIDY